jgi:hypothetical protein
MMAASMKGNKRKSTSKAPAPRAPPRRSARVENKFLWDRLRNTKDVMRHVYSYLSVSDLVHVAEVDRTFRDDEDRGTVVSSYGDEGLDLHEAFESVKKWHDFEMSPDYQMDETREFYVEREIEIRAEWYTPEGGWDLERIMVRCMFFLMQQFKGCFWIQRSHARFIPIILILSHRLKVIFVITTTTTTRKRPFSSTPR